MNYKNKFVGLILVRSKSKRLPNKCFLKFGKMNILEHIIKRCIFYKIVPIVCTSKNKHDDKIIYYAKKNKVPYFRGSEKNKLERIANCCKELNLEKFHLVDADDPFFCGEEMIRSLKKLQSENLDIVYPTKLSLKGTGLVSYSIKNSAIKKINKMIKKNIDTENLFKIFKLTKNLKTKYLNEVKKRIFARITLDYYEDYVFLELLRLVNGNFAKREKIELFLKKNKFLTKINLFRNIEWKKNQ